MTSNDATKTASIYGLFDPRDGSLRYIGCTVQHIEARLAGHIGGISDPCNGAEKSAWIAGLLQSGLRPEVTEIEAVPYAERLNAEKFWIHYYRFVGCDLFNIKYVDTQWARDLWAGERGERQRELVRRLARARREAKASLFNPFPRTQAEG